MEAIEAAARGPAQPSAEGGEHNAMEALEAAVRATSPGLESSAAGRHGVMAALEAAARETAPVQAASAAPRIAVDDFAEAVYGAVLRATEARKLPASPIIFGIIWFPEGGFRGPTTGPGIG